MHVLAEVLGSADENTAESLRTADVRPISSSVIREGELFRVAAGKCAAISLVGGVAAVAHERTEFVPNELSVTKDGNETSISAMIARSVKIEMHSGTMSFSTDPETGAKVTIEVRLSRATVTPQVGAIFYVTATNDVKRVTCARGDVEVRSESTAVTLHAGHAAEITGSGGVVTAVTDEVAIGREAKLALRDDELLRSLIGKKQDAERLRGH